MAVAAAYRTVTGGLEWELGDLLAAVCACPAPLDHWSVTAVVTLWSAAFKAIATFQRIETVFARLERQLGDLCAATATGPGALHHRFARKTTTVIVTVHM